MRLEVIKKEKRSKVYEQLYLQLSLLISNSEDEIIHEDIPEQLDTEDFEFKVNFKKKVHLKIVTDDD